MLTDAPTADLRSLPSDASGRAAPASLQPVCSFRDHIVCNLDAVWRTARRLGVRESELEDLAQEVALVAMRRAESIEAGKERAFMLATAVRIAANWRRARHRQAGHDAESVTELRSEGRSELAVPPSQERDLDRARGLALLDAALAQMTEHQRVALLLQRAQPLSSGAAPADEAPRAAQTALPRQLEPEVGSGAASGSASPTWQPVHIVNQNAASASPAAPAAQPSSPQELPRQLSPRAGRAHSTRDRVRSSQH